MKYLSPINNDILYYFLPKRQAETHKGNYGKILLLCGSRGYTGAAAFAALGALRTGAGLVYLGVPESIYEIESVKLLEPVIIPLPDEAGSFGTDSSNVIKSILPNMDAVLIGPGIGKTMGAFSTVEYVLKNAVCPVVLDADGINVISEHKDILRERTSPTILTPHDGEFRRIGGVVLSDRVEAAGCLARDLGCILLLKGNRTIITDGDEYYINQSGNPGMATGGSGDVLAGIIVSFLGQGLDPLQAAACGAWVHGCAGDICASEIGQYGMLPQDMVNVLPRLLP